MDDFLKDLEEENDTKFSNTKNHKNQLEKEENRVDLPILDDENFLQLLENVKKCLNNEIILKFRNLE